ncbi:molecular chaperone [Erwinia sp.]|uniref:fimbrial biogenesis chaperone n=1 Tax=Erwinia citreus TaxID=558 RepID=UPI00289E166E|nr:molecular chaperone [Erwinia sp.]
MRSFIFVILASVLAFACVPASHADGLSLGATRLIYSEGKKEASVPLNNIGSSVPYLIQAWVTDFNQKEGEVPFITTPPLFKLGRQASGTVRVVYTGSGPHLLPTDRESLFLLNVRAVPAVSKEASSNRLTIATQNIIKLIYRPAGLTVKGAGEAWRQLKVTPGESSLTVANPTPYVVTLTRMKINNKPLEQPGTLQPFSSRALKAPVGKITTVTFSTINDFGGFTPEHHEKF